MINEQNLIPLNKRSKEDQRAIQEMGRQANREKWKKKLSTAELVNTMLSSKLSENAKKKVKELSEELSDEALDINALMVAGQVKSAINGNVKAFECLQGYNEKAQKQEEKEPYTIPITDITVDFVETYRKIHEAYTTGNIREIISKGGRGSIKSNFWSAVAEETILQDRQAHVVFTRRYKTDLRGSVYHQFQKTITRHGKVDEWEFTTSPMIAKYKKTGQCVLFVGCDKPISLKSYNLPFGYVKLLIHEECDEMAGVEQMDSVEDTFLRDDINAIDVKVFNPPKSANNFMNEYTLECANKEGTYISHSYYYNVPLKWLGKRFFDRAEWFKENKPKYYRNNYLGEVVGTGGGIFENVEERTITDEEIKTFTYTRKGLDFGYEHPQTFIEVYYDAENDIVYPINEVYARRCRNVDFARKIKKYKDCEIICDSARPDNIADLREWGFEDAIGAVKRWQNKGRAYCWEWLQQANKIVVDAERTPNLARELRKLEFEQLKDGSFSSEYPTLNEDCTMALIYALNHEIMEHGRTDTYNDNEDVDYSDDMED